MLELRCQKVGNKMPGRQGKTPGSTAPSAGGRTRLQRLVTKLFRDHWRAVNADLTNGINVASNRAHFFYASSRRVRLRLARRYYAPGRVSKRANALDDEILNLLDAWLGAFRNHVDYDLVEGRELRKELRQLVAAEYVAVAWNSPDPFDRPLQEVTAVSPLPDEPVAYGDVYEITASGYSCGAFLRICKSVAEPFRESERFETMAGIKREFFDNARADGEPKGAWKLNFLESEDPRLIEVNVKPGSRWITPAILR